MESMELGGAERSLITLLSRFDYDKYDVDLFLFHHSGELLDKIPSKVNLLPAPKKYNIFLQNRKLSWMNLLLKGYIKHSVSMCFYLAGVLYSRIKKEPLYIGWKYVKELFDNIEKEYDVSISYLERKTMYFNVDRVNAKRKIGFIHNNYEKYPYDKQLDNFYFQFFDYIPTVSCHCKNVLMGLFPEYKQKFVVIPNMVSKEEIVALSKEKITENINFGTSKKIVSVGRLVKQKGFDLAIAICKKLIDNGYDVKWYVIGEGEERKILETLIKENQLENYFFLVGADKNPYKWMRIADVYVQPSRFEGFGITVAEAIALKKPIVASNIPEFRVLLNNKKCYLASNIDQFVEKIETMLCSNNVVHEEEETESLYPLKCLYELIEEVKNEKNYKTNISTIL